jgi:hypothetical protein
VGAANEDARHTARHSVKCGVWIVIPERPCHNFSPIAARHIRRAHTVGQWSQDLSLRLAKGSPTGIEEDDTQPYSSNQIMVSRHDSALGQLVKLMMRLNSAQPDPLEDAITSLIASLDVHICL